MQGRKETSNPACSGHVHKRAYLCFLFPFLIDVKFIQNKGNHFKVKNSVVFGTFTVFCKYQCYVVRKHFCHTKGNVIPI